MHITFAKKKSLIYIIEVEFIWFCLMNLIQCFYLDKKVPHFSGLQFLRHFYIHGSNVDSEFQICMQFCSSCSYLEQGKKWVNIF